MTETEPIISECRLARRIARLFRIERSGKLDGRPVTIIKRMIERRGALIDDLLVLDRLRCSLAERRSAQLDHALTELVQEVNRALRPARARRDEIGADLRFRLGKAPPSGIRDGGHGKLLGSS